MLLSLKSSGQFMKELSIISALHPFDSIIRTKETAHFIATETLVWKQVDITSGSLSPMFGVITAYGLKVTKAWRITNLLKFITARRSSLMELIFAMDLRSTPLPLAASALICVSGQAPDPPSEPLTREFQAIPHKSWEFFIFISRCYSCILRSITSPSVSIHPLVDNFVKRSTGLQGRRNQAKFVLDTRLFFWGLLNT